MPSHLGCRRRRLGTPAGGAMKQVVVAAVVLVVFFVGGPWFANRVGPGLADLITQIATPPSPCPTATALPTHPRPHQARRAHRVHGPERHRHRPRAAVRPTPSAAPSSTCSPTPSPEPSPATR